MVKSKNLEKIKNKLYACLGCGSCFRGPHNPFVEEASPNQMCPIYSRFRFQSHTKRGMGYLAKQVYFDELEIDDDLAHPFFTCMTCLNCAECCIQSPALEMIRGMREEIFLRKPEAIPKAILSCNANIAAKLNSFGEDQTKRVNWAADLHLPKKGDILYFAGCTASLKRKGSSAHLIVDTLSSSGVKLAYLGEEESCCGYLALNSGRPEIYEEMVKRNVEAIRTAGAKQVVVGCTGCLSALKDEYPKVAGDLPFKVIHVTELLAELIEEKKIGKLASAKKMKVTYHDPCHLGRYMGIYTAPRKILESIENIELVEMPRNKRFSWCCGSGSGVVALGYPEFANWTAKQRLLEAESTGAETLVTSCYSCYDNFVVAESKEDDIKIEIRDLLELVASCSG
jgi:heterodisulfide reductase subunit D